MGRPNWCDACGGYRPRDHECIPRSLSDERDAWLKRLLDAEHAAYLAGHADGDRAGFERGARLLEAEHRSGVHAMARQADAFDHRWDLRGEHRTRGTFADPHPGDRPAGG